MAEKKDHDASQPAQPIEAEHADGRTEHPSVRYEKRDVRSHWILAVIVAAICIGGMQLFFVRLFYLDRREHLDQTLKASRYPLAPVPSLRLPAEPRLEQLDRMAGIETSNVYRRELSSEQMLAGYGPTAAKGYIHVPLERAMEQVIGELPIRKQPPRDEAGPAKDNGLLDAGDSNSGRMFRGTSR